MTIHMSNNVVDGIAKDFNTGNEVYGKAVLTQEIHGNQFGHIGGSMSSHNKVDNRG